MRYGVSMTDKDYIIKKYSDVIERAIADENWEFAIECINHLADFHLVACGEVEKEEWE
jgi:hypothetical protein